MRILFFSSIFPRESNVTAGIYCLHVCHAARELGHDVRVVSPRSFLDRARTKPRLEMLDGLEVDYPLYVYPPRVLHDRRHHFMGASSQRTMRRVMREFRPDCILSYWVHPDGAVAAHFARGAGIPSAVIAGGSDILVLTRTPGRRRESIVRALRAIDSIITVGADLADAVAALGIERRKIHVVYQGVDKALFAPGPASEARRRLGLASEGPVLVTVGNLLPIKGIDVLLEALRSLRECRPDIRVYVIGEGASRGDLEALAERLGLRSTVHFLGTVDQRALPDWYRAADLTILSSRSEGVPNVLRESLASGTPFIATRVGGVHEIARGTCCPLVTPESPAELASAIGRSLERPRAELVGTPQELLSWRESTEQLLRAVGAPTAQLHPHLLSELSSI